MNQNVDDELKMKKKQLTFYVLEAWYRGNYGSSSSKPSLVVMISDFEQFNKDCVQSLISIMCSYANRLPFVLVVGIATAFKALHNVLPPHVVNQMYTKVFRAETSTVMLNRILEEVILTPHNPVQLSGKALKILMDIFLFYDYSLHSFVKGYKAFMLEHFINRPVSSLLINLDDDAFSHEDCEAVRRNCQSFRDLVESSDPNTRIGLLTSDEFLVQSLVSIVVNFKKYLLYFYCSLQILVILLDDLPKNELGKHIRELYPICFSSDITKLDEYKECFKLMRFTSKGKILSKLDKIISTVQATLADEKFTESQKQELETILEKLAEHYQAIHDAGMSPENAPASSASKAKTPPSSEAKKKVAKSRQELMASLEKNAKNNQPRTCTAYESHLWSCLHYLDSLMEKYLRPLKQAPPLNEFFVLNDCLTVRRQIVGAPRGALHNALNNPHHYLHCSCCVLTENEPILPTLPETSIAYKLHLESNKFINLYDWLQAFSTVQANDEDEEITPEVQ